MSSLKRLKRSRVRAAAPNVIAITGGKGDSVDVGGESEDESSDSVITQVR